MTSNVGAKGHHRPPTAPGFFRGGGTGDDALMRGQVRHELRQTFQEAGVSQPVDEIMIFRRLDEGDMLAITRGFSPRWSSALRIWACALSWVPEETARRSCLRPGPQRAVQRCPPPAPHHPPEIMDRAARCCWRAAFRRATRSRPVRGRDGIQFTPSNAHIHLRHLLENLCPDFVTFLGSLNPFASLCVRFAVSRNQKFGVT